MEKVEKIIDTLHLKIKQLVEENKELKQKVSGLVDESSRYQGLLDERKKALTNLESQRQAEIAAGQYEKNTDIDKAKGKIDELVREIDRCINLLSR